MIKLVLCQENLPFVIFSFSYLFILSAKYCHDYSETLSLSHSLFIFDVVRHYDVWFTEHSETKSRRKQSPS